MTQNLSQILEALDTAETETLKEIRKWTNAKLSAKSPNPKILEPMRSFQAEYRFDEVRLAYGQIRRENKAKNGGS